MTDKLDKVLNMERQLHSNLRVAEKYDILEQLRIVLDKANVENPSEYEKCIEFLKPSTWYAIEEIRTLWNPVPKNHVEWVGPGEMTCILKSTHPYFAECAELGFTRCTYDEHASPDFSEATFPGSVVDISDLYDSLCKDNIRKRGGSPKSLQEIAQMRMVPNLRKAIKKWAEENGKEEDFWEWRNALNLVPHEDPNCRTMRLVYRPVHIAFKHRGGIANALTIRTRFGR